MLREEAIDSEGSDACRITCVEHDVLELDAREGGEIVLAPDQLVCRPVLQISCQGSEVRVEDIFSGDRALAKNGHWPVECFREGQVLETSASREVPIKIVVFNEGPEKTVVSASLSTRRQP